MSSAVNLRETRVVKISSAVFKLAIRELRVLLWEVLRRLLKKITISTQQGRYQLPLNLNDPISRILFVEGNHELDFMTLAVEKIKEITNYPHNFSEGTVIDVGANNGVTGIGMLVNKQCETVVAIEVDKKNCEFLKKNIELNHLHEKFHLIQCAVSNRTGDAKLEFSENNLGDHHISQVKTNDNNDMEDLVPCETLDNLINNVPDRFKKNLNFVNIDIQGHEGFAFEGAKELIKSGIPFITEVWPKGIIRSGMTHQTFLKILNENFTHFWALRHNYTGPKKFKFVRYPIEHMKYLFDEIGNEGDYANFILIKENS